MNDTLIDQILTDPHSAIGVLIPAGRTPVAEYSALCDILVELDPEASNNMPTDLEFEKLSPEDQTTEIFVAAEYIDTAIWELDNTLAFCNVVGATTQETGWQIIRTG